MKRSLQERLAALQRSAEPIKPVNMPVQMEPTEAVVDKLGMVVEMTLAGPVWVRRTAFDMLARHGLYCFQDWLSADMESLAKMAKTDTPQPQQVLFYDTETTGLGTGAGTFPFIHAVGQFEADEFVVYQYFLHDYAAEQALLKLLFERHFDSEKATIILTFNGKSFDWPLLKSRSVMHRLALPDGLGQWDLLHPSRRLWRRTIGKVSLSHVESEVLGLERIDDLPGQAAPERFFAFQSGGSAEDLLPVFSHNLMDVCSLVTLGVQVSGLLSGTVPATQAAQWMALGRWFDEWSAAAQATRCYRVAVECPDVQWQDHWRFSLHCKRQGDDQRAVALWEQMLTDHEWTVLPAVELAKHAEHRLRQYDRAMIYTEIALDRVRIAIALRLHKGEAASEADAQIVAGLMHRLARIARKAEVAAGSEP